MMRSLELNRKINSYKQFLNEFSTNLGTVLLTLNSLAIATSSSKPLLSNSIPEILLDTASYKLLLNELNKYSADLLSIERFPRKNEITAPAPI